MSRMLLIALLLPGLAYSQAMRDPAVGRLLVADRDLPDPNFAETVILLVQYDKNGAMGLVLNHPTEVPLSRALKEVETAKGRKEFVFVGGPVEKRSIVALARVNPTIPDKADPEDGEPVVAGVRLITTRTLLDKWLRKAPGQGEFRVYVGYAGWGPGQLEHELDLGAWHLFNADAGAIFDANPNGIWLKWIKRTENGLAWVRR